MFPNLFITVAHLLSIPDNVMIQHLFTCLDHNDILRLRRVCKRTKSWADAYLWTPQPGHQGKWELKIDSSKEDEALEAFLQMDLPPPSRLYIINKAEKGPLEKMSFFEDEHLEEFMNRYSKYVTHLKIDKLFIPFTSAKEIGFYESLVNLNKLRCFEMIRTNTQLEEKTSGTEENFLIQPTWSKKLKIFKLDQTDSMDSMWDFINGVSNNLEELLHPFQSNHKPADMNAANFNRTNFAPVQQLIERRGRMKSQRKLLYDWRYLFQSDHLELLRVFASCRDNGVMIKKLNARYLDCLICDETGWIDRDEYLYSKTGEWSRNSRVNYQRNQFLGSLIHSLTGVSEYEFLMDLPALEEISVFRTDRLLCYICPTTEYAHARWPNLRKINLIMNSCTTLHFEFLFGKIERPNLEELSLSYRSPVSSWYTTSARDFFKCCGNLKKLTISNYFFVGSDFYSRLWKWVPVLEDVTLEGCTRLTNAGFVGSDKSRPAFLKLTKLKNLSINNLEATPLITDAVFRDVFRHLKLTSFKLSSDKAIKKITVAGIIELLTGPFAKTIEKLDLDQLQLQNVSKEQLKEVVSCFRSSKML